MQDKSIAEIEHARMRELEKQAALFGPSTAPQILMELSELRKKYKRPRRSPARNIQLDIDLLTNVLASTLQRVTLVEEALQRDEAQRQQRQQLLDVWLTVNTVLLLVEIALLAIRW